MKVRIAYSGVGPTQAQPLDDEGTEHAARAVRRWAHDGRRSLPPDRRPQAM